MSDLPDPSKFLPQWLSDLKYTTLAYTSFKEKQIEPFDCNFPCCVGKQHSILRSMAQSPHNWTTYIKEKLIALDPRWKQVFDDSLFISNQVEESNKLFHVIARNPYELDDLQTARINNALAAAQEDERQARKARESKKLLDVLAGNPYELDDLQTGAH